MHKFLLTVLTLGVCFGCTLGDVKCFLTQIGACSIAVGAPPAGLAGSFPSTDFCKNRKAFFGCLRDTEKNCSVQYNLDEMEKLYDVICTNGTFLNRVFMQYQECILKSIKSHTSCSQDIIDFAKKFKVITPDVLFEICKLACKERDSISQCLYDFVGKDCGLTAKVLMEVISRPSDKVNNKICRDALHPDQV